MSGVEKLLAVNEANFFDGKAKKWNYMRSSKNASRNRVSANSELFGTNSIEPFGSDALGTICIKKSESRYGFSLSNFEISGTHRNYVLRNDLKLKPF